MSGAQPYVIVSTDPGDLTIHGGPLAWDGVSTYNPGMGMKLMLTSDAVAAGYTFPAPDPGIVNAQSLQSKASTALTGNSTYLGLSSPTTAQAVAQVAALTRQMNALIRLQLNLLDSTSGT